MKILQFIYIGVVMTLESIWYGFVLTKLWLWFMVSTFDLPVINIPTAIGIYLTIGFMTKRPIKPEKNLEGKAMMKALIEAISSSLVTPAFALIVGYIVLQFI